MKWNLVDRVSGDESPGLMKAELYLAQQPQDRLVSSNHTTAISRISEIIRILSVKEK